MNDDHADRRREDRIPLEVKASVESEIKHLVAHATSVDMTSSGVLLHFDEPVSLAVGDRVSCDFVVSHEPNRPLPYWGLGKIVRVDADTVAVDLQTTGFTKLDFESSNSDNPFPDAH